MSRVQLKDTCEWLLGEGILSSLTANFEVPWQEKITDGQDLDDDYYGNRSGEKECSNLTEKLLDDEGKLSTEDTERLASVIFNKYNLEWQRAWLALHEEYDPLSNYNLHEVEKPAETTKTVTPAETTTTTKVPEMTTSIKPASTKVETKVAEVNREIKTPETTTSIKTPETTKSIKTPETTTSIKTPETTTKITPSLVKDTTEDFINGFDSKEAVPSNKRVSTPQLISGGTGEEKVTQGTKAGEQKVEQGANAGEEKITQGINAGEEKVVQGAKAGEDNITQGLKPGEESLTVLANGEEKVTQGDEAGEEKITVNRAGSEVYTTQKDRDLQRDGNIGIRSTQELLKQEINLRIKYNFFDTIVFPHIDKVLCLSYYKDTSRNLF